MNEKIEKLQDQINSLPVGYISKKNIRGKERYYRQWKEDGKVKSEYIPADSVDYIADLIRDRNELKSQLLLETYKNDESKAAVKRLKEYAEEFYLTRRVGIGTQYFDKVIEGNQFYIDKTYFIYDWWTSSDEVTLITRPRRFGKTLNLDMMKCFFSIKYENRADLFKGLDVWNYDSMQNLQGTYPVIAISLATMKEQTVEGQLTELKALVAAVFREFYFLRDAMSASDQEQFDRYINNFTYTDGMAIDGLRVLSEILCNTTKKKVILLIDEYDTPMTEAWLSGIIDECTNYLKQFLSRTLKHNKNLERALITGITKVSKESFFSDMNNVRVCSMSSDKYDYAFGFTEEEVFHAMDERGLSEKEEVKRWYDGFTIGSRTDIYNPWSITYFFDTNEFRPYWINTSSNQLINDIFKRGTVELKNQLEDLIRGKHLVAKINEDISFKTIENDETAFWSMLYASGYVKSVSNSVDENNEVIYELAVTNKEVKDLLVNIVKSWFSNLSIGYNEFIRALLIDDVDYMQEYMERVIRNVFSYYDVSGQEPERFYHGFVLGMVVDLERRYVITSNRESGDGRYDVILKPKNPDDHAIIMEFKVHRARKEASLAETARNALKQIEDKNYKTDLIADGVEEDNIYTYGIAFKGKEVWIEGTRNVLQ